MLTKRLEIRDPAEADRARFDDQLWTIQLPRGVP
jgi:hypothetical protein